MALLGTQFEDLGLDAVLAIDTTNTKLGELSGSTEKLDAQYDTLPQKFEALKRRALVALSPIGDKLLDLAEDVFPILEAAIEKIGPAIEVVSEFVTDTLAPAFSDFVDFINTDFIPTFRDNITPALKVVSDFVELTLIPTLEDISKTFNEDVKPKIQDFINFIESDIPLIEATFKTAWEAMKGALEAFMLVWNDSVMPPLRTTMAELTKIIEDLDIDWRAIWEGLKAFVTGFVAGIGLAIGVLIATFTGLVVAIVDTVANIVTALNNLQDASALTFESIGNFIQAFSDLFTAIISGDFSGAIEAGERDVF